MARPSPARLRSKGIQCGEWGSVAQHPQAGMTTGAFTGGLGRHDMIVLAMAPDTIGLHGRTPRNKGLRRAEHMGRYVRSRSAVSRRFVALCRQKMHESLFPPT